MEAASQDSVAKGPDPVSYILRSALNKIAHGSTSLLTQQKIENDLAVLPEAKQAKKHRVG